MIASTNERCNVSMKNLQVHGLSLSFGERRILSDISFNLSEKSRVALMGANGCGKSTLLKAISGNMEAESMSIALSKGTRISYLPQSDIVPEGKSVYDAAEHGYDRFMPALNALKKLEGMEANLKNAEMIASLHEELAEGGYYDRKSRIEQVLLGLGFEMRDMERPVEDFSGGYQMRIALARVLLEASDFLLLDEPTNYLDIDALTYLEGFIKGYGGGVVLVSHDQDFIDSTCTEIFSLDHGKLKAYKGNYESYIRQIEEEKAEREKSYLRQKEEIERTEAFIERFRYKATKAKQVQSRIKALEKIEEIELDESSKKVSFSFPEAPRSGDDTLIIEHLSKAYGDNVIYDDFSMIINRGERVAITGRNGSGKSTLLRMIAGADKDYDGIIRYGSNVLIGYYAQDSSESINAENTVLEEIESIADTRDIPRVRNMLGAFLFSGDDVKKKCSVLSGGEKSRLALLKILMHPANLLILDEPTNHLDIGTKEILLDAVSRFDGTVIFVSHDKHFISHLATRILYLNGKEREEYIGNWDYFNFKLKEKEARFLESGKDREKEEKTVQKSDDENDKARKNRRKKLERELEAIDERIAELEESIKALEDESMRSEVYSNASKITRVMEEKRKKEEMRVKNGKMRFNFGVFEKRWTNWKKSCIHNLILVRICSIIRNSRV